MSIFSGPQGKRAMRAHKRKLQDEAYSRALAIGRIAMPDGTWQPVADPVVFLPTNRRPQ